MPPIPILLYSTSFYTLSSLIHFMFYSRTGSKSCDVVRTKPVGAKIIPSIEVRTNCFKMHLLSTKISWNSSPMIKVGCASSAYVTQNVGWFIFITHSDDIGGQRGHALGCGRCLIHCSSPASAPSFMKSIVLSVSVDHDVRLLREYWNIRELPLLKFCLARLLFHCIHYD